MSRELLSKFSELYKEKIGEPYPPTWGRDLKILKDVDKHFGLDKGVKLLEIYFDRKSKIYSIPFFKAALGELVQEEIKQRVTIAPPIVDNESWRFT